MGKDIRSPLFVPDFFLYGFSVENVAYESRLSVISVLYNWTSGRLIPESSDFRYSGLIGRVWLYTDLAVLTLFSSVFVCFRLFNFPQTDPV